MYVFLESSSTSRIDDIVIAFALVFDVFVIITHWGRVEMAAVPYTMFTNEDYSILI